MEKILIVGLGLIGGSVARSLVNRYEVYALDKSKSTLEKARQYITKGYTDLKQVDINPNAVVLCLPVSGAISMAPALKDKFANSIFIDCCSTKRSVQNAYGNCNYAGMHPMAGSEGSGFEHSRSGLFRGAVMCITGSGKAAQYAHELAVKLEGRPMVMDAQSHDRAVAMVSHLPHLVAAALCFAAKQQSDHLEITKDLAAGGFADLTRIADSDPTMWGAIFSDNADMVLKSMDGFQKSIDTWRKLLQEGNEQQLKQYFDTCKQSKQSFKRNESGIFPKGGASVFVPCKEQDIPNIAQKAFGMGAKSVEKHGDGVKITCAQRGECQAILKALGGQKA